MTCAKRTRTARAFTLVELLVVIGIIALLISILLPVLNKAREQAKAISCASNEKQVLLAFTMYVSAHKGATPIFPPIGMTFPQTTPYKRSAAYYMDSKDGGLGVIRYDVGSFWPYMTSGIHTTVTKPNPGTANSPPPEVLYRVFNCPSDTDYRDAQQGGTHFQSSIDRNFTYSWNGSFWDNPMKPIGDAPTDPPKVWGNEKHGVSRINQIVEGAHKIILFEEAHPNDGWCWMGFPPGDADDTPSFRHNGRANYGFADGHVESMDPTDIGYSRVYHYTDDSTIVNPQTAAYYLRLQSNAK